MLKTLGTTVAAATLAMTPALAADHHKEKMKGEVKSGTIAAKAMSTDSLSTLVAAAKLADIVPVLKGDGPLTVFAPTNDAFDEVEDTVDGLSDEQVARVLKAHVVKLNLTAADLIMLTAANDGSVNINTVAGDTITVTATDDGLTLTDENGGTAMVETADVEASNGTVHIIDAVLVPVF